MVQFRVSNSDADCWKLVEIGSPTSKYWREKLGEKNYLFNKCSNAARMRVHISRAERGLMSYEKRSVAELRSFCVNRKISILGLANSSRALVARLEGEDETGTTFRRFLDLPPELRLHVYEYYLDDIQGRWWLRRDDRPCLTYTLLSPPPIAQTCALMRQETLPLFARSFRLNVGLAHEVSSQAEKQKDWFRVVGSICVKNFTKASPHLLAMARRLLVSGEIMTRGFRVLVKCTIDLPIGQRALQVSTDVTSRPGYRAQAPDQLLKEVDSALNKEAHKFVEEMGARSNGMVLEHGDHLEIAKICDRTILSLSALPN